MILKSIDRFRTGLQDALKAGEHVAERLALAEVDAVIQTNLRGILIPTTVVALLLGVAEASAALIHDPEIMRLAVTSILLLAGLYGSWALATGIIGILPVLSVWAATRVNPRRLATLFLYELIVTRLQQAFSTQQGTPSVAGRLARYALRFSGRPSSWEGLAFRLADRIAPRMIRHALMQTLLVLAPASAAWAYYRFKIVPGIVRDDIGLTFWSAFFYPVAALIDVIFGTSLRTMLLVG
jgi:hypothetical protein